jgi:hypothetical protein
MFIYYKPRDKSGAAIVSSDWLLGMVASASQASAI